MIGGLSHLAHEVRGDEDGTALGGQAAAGLPDPDDSFGVQAVDGLVEEEDLGVAQESGGHAEALAHAQGESFDALLGHGGQAGQFQNLIDPSGGDGVGDGQLGQMGACRSRPVQALGIQQGADLPQRGGQEAVGTAVDFDRAGGGLVQAHDHAHGGGFARSVGAEEAGDGAGRDGE